MSLLGFLLAVLVCGVVIRLLVTGFRIWGLFKNAQNEFRKGFDGTYHQQSHYEDQEIVIDPRNADERSRKIISEDEGEYVDFESET